LVCFQYSAKALLELDLSNPSAKADGNS
jgi:hypothetical protein